MVRRQYGLPDNVRLFPVGCRAVQNKMRRQIEKAGVKRIRFMTCDTVM